MSKNTKPLKNNTVNEVCSSSSIEGLRLDMIDIVDNLIYVTTPGTVESKSCPRNGKTRQVNLYSNHGFNAKGEKVAFTVWGEYADKALELFR